jgi:hypothetical protein
MALVARDRTLDGIAADKRLQLNDVDEVIGLAAQLIRNHRRLAGNRRDRHDAAPFRPMAGNRSLSTSVDAYLQLIRLRVSAYQYQTTR